MKEKLSLTRDGLALYGLLEGPDPDVAELNSVGAKSETSEIETERLETNAEGQKKLPLAIIMHGFNTNSRQTPFYELTRALWSRGIATLRFDFSCHGRSEGDMAEMTVEGLTEDAETFYDYVVRLPFVSEIILIGYSLGGVIASHLAVKHSAASSDAAATVVAGDSALPTGIHKIRKLVLLSPAADIRFRAESGFFFGNTYDPADPPEVMETEMFRIGRPYFLSAQNVVVYEHLKSFDGKALIVYGKADEYVPEEMTLDYRNYIKDLKIVPVPEADHLWTKNADIAVQEIINFLS